VVLWVGLRFLWAGYAVVAVAAFFFFLAVGPARRASMRYLDLVRGRRGFFRRRWDTYRHMATYGVLLLDRALMLARPKHGFAVDCQGLVHLTAVSRPPEGGGSDAGVILLSAHFGMAEIAAPYMRRMGLRRPINIVMYQDPQDGTEQFHTRHRRELSDMTIISTTDPLAAGVKIIRALRGGEVVAMRADRTLNGKGVAVTLLGRRVELPAGPFVAAALSGAAVLQVYTCRVGHRWYRCTISAARRYGDGAGGSRDERVARAAQDFATHLEGVLRQFPDQWSNFYDLWAAQAAGRQTDAAARVGAAAGECAG
jgi:KDO2-lipid IV(A) lauroyltransferase